MPCGPLPELKQLQFHKKRDCGIVGIISKWPCRQCVTRQQLLDWMRQRPSDNLRLSDVRNQRHHLRQTAQRQPRRPAHTAGRAGQLLHHWSKKRGSSPAGKL